jgi:hypothetical protein
MGWLDISDYMPVTERDFLGSLDYPHSAGGGTPS